MKTLIQFLTVTFLTLPFSASVHAQGASINSNALENRIYDIQTDVGKGLAHAEGAQRFGSNQYSFQVVNSGGNRS